ncbi:MAG: MarR family transcriptional regulator [Candidatus Thorarchaeota archaeon]
MFSKKEKSQIASLPPSSRAVLEVLMFSGGMTPKDIMKSVRIAPRTVRAALKELLTRNLIHKIPYLQDMRHVVYQVNLI